MSNENSETNDTPDGVSAAPDGAAPAKATRQMDDRELAIHRRQIAIQERNEVIARNKELEAKIAELEAKVKPPRPSAKPSEEPAIPEWARAVIEKVDGLGQEVKASKSTRAREDAHKSILERVPEGNREAARLVLRGLEADGLDFTSPGAVDTAIGKLPQSVLHDASRPSPRRAPQRGPDGSLDFSAFKHPDEIPAEFRAAAFKDKATMTRLMGSVGQGSTREADGFNI
jgi:hypothetical protein